MLWGKEFRSLSRLIGLQRLADFSKFKFGFFVAGSQTLKHIPTLIPTTNRAEPARAFWHCKQQKEKDSGGQCFDSEHPAPSNIISEYLGDDVIRKIGQQNTEHDIELYQAYQSTTVGWRGNFGGIDRRDDRRSAYTDASNEAHEHEGVPVGGKSATQCRDKIQNSDHEQYQFASVAIDWWTNGGGTNNGSDQRGSNREAEPEITQIILGDQCFIGS